MIVRLPVIVYFVRPQIKVFLAGVIVGFAIGLLVFLIAIGGNYSYDPYERFYNSTPNLNFVEGHSANDMHHRMLNTSLADQLHKEIRIICVVLTKPSNHFTKAAHVKATWGRRCTKLLFISTEDEPLLPTINIDIREDRDHLWGKTKAALRYVYEHYRGEYDWVYKADDDTYAVMENMRYMLHYSDSSEAVYYGCKLKYRFAELNYMSGGAGYVLSREALRRFIEIGLTNKTLCRHEDTGDEDVEMGKCLRSVGVQLGNSLDDEKRNRFTPVFVNKMLVPGVLENVEWYIEMMENPRQLGLQCCSDNLISTHYVAPYQLYLLEYLIYHVTPFGRGYHPMLKDRKALPATKENLPEEETQQWKDFD